MKITHTPQGSATQTARWTADDERYSAMVARTSHQDSETGKRGWAYSLRYPTEYEGVVTEHTFADKGELIWTHETDPLDVLHTLAVFISAWDEGVQYTAMSGHEGENVDLFPDTCASFLNVAEEFYMTTMRGEIDG